MTTMIVVGSLVGALLLFWIYIEQGRLIRPSTIAALKASGLKNILNGKAIHGVFYGRWVTLYLRFFQKLIPRLGERGKRWFGNTYHGKVMPPELARAIVMLDRDIPLQDLGEQVIPYTAARDIVLTASPDIVVTECGCRATRDNPCKPSQVCMAVGKPFSDYILEHHPRVSRRIDQDEALKILEEVHDRGWVHHAYFKDTCLNAFYALCNCCSCCCSGFEAMRFGIPMIFSSGYVSKVDRKKCGGCGTCVTFCPFKAACLDEKGKAVVIWDNCMGCGVCVSKCPHGARKLKRDEKKPKPLDVRKLA